MAAKKTKKRTKTGKRKKSVKQSKRKTRKQSKAKAQSKTESSYFLIVKTMIVNPNKHFKEVKKDKGFKKPVLFLLKTGLMGGSIITALLLLFALWVAIANKSLLPIGNALIMGLIITAVLSIALLAGAFVMAGIYHLMLRLFKVKGKYAQAFKAVAYSDAPVGPFAIILFIPIISFGLNLWRIILSIFGLAELYDTDGGTAAAAVIIPILIMSFILIIVLISYFSVISL